MAAEISTIQSLKAVDAWIDVINANINGGVRTAFKSSRLKFSGSNTDVSRAGTTTSLPLQFPEPGLTTANTVIDFSQGAVTSSSENSHLAVQGEGFFMLAHPSMFDFNNTAGNVDFGTTLNPATAGVQPGLLLTRDGEFHTDQFGFLVSSFGWYLTIPDIFGTGVRFDYDSANFGDASSRMRLVYNDLDGNPSGPPNNTGGTMPQAGRIYFLSHMLRHDVSTVAGTAPTCGPLINVIGGKQQLEYSKYGSTVFDFGFAMNATNTSNSITAGIKFAVTTAADATILSKSLEASNASMTQSVPELSLAQKLFSALTKVLQTKQTNVDGVLNLVR